MAACSACIEVEGTSCPIKCEFANLFSESHEGMQRFQRLRNRYNLNYIKEQLKALTDLHDKKLFLESLDYETLTSVQNPVGGSQAVVQDLQNQIQASQAAYDQLQNQQAALQNLVRQHQARIEAQAAVITLTAKRLDKLATDCKTWQADLRNALDQ